MAAVRRVRGTSSPTPPSTSHTPVNVTINAGLGTDGGTILIRSARMLEKWAERPHAKSSREPSDERHREKNIEGCHSRLSSAGPVEYRQPRVITLADGHAPADLIVRRNCVAGAHRAGSHLLDHRTANPAEAGSHVQKGNAANRLRIPRNVITVLSLPHPP